MKTIRLGKTGIYVPQNCFGALPIQRVKDMDRARALIRRAYDGGMRLFDSARAYTDSEEKLGLALSDVREDVVLATKTLARTPEDFWRDLETSLRLLRTDHIDLYQFHCVRQCYRPGDGTGMYEAMLEAKRQGKILHIGVTAHLLNVARECVDSGLYETLQFPFSYISGAEEIGLVEACRGADMGFIAMKSLAGGLITNARAAYAFAAQFDHVAPIWGIQREEELDQWLALGREQPEMTEEIRAFIEKDKPALAGEFCRGCGYCMPCPMGIEINSCARMSLMMRRSRVTHEPEAVAREAEMMRRIETCVHCGKCAAKCPYRLDTPSLLQKNYEDWKQLRAGEI